MSPGDLQREIEARTPTISLVVGASYQTEDLQRGFLRAYDTLVNYAKAMALGDECQNPLDRGESRR